MKPILIDSNAEMPTRRKQINRSWFIGHRERLSEWASRTDDAIVRTLQEINCKRLAEMTNPFYFRKSNNFADVSFDANADNSNNIGLTVN